MPGKGKASLVEKLQDAGFISDQPGSGNLWEFLSMQNPGIVFSKGTKSVEFLKRYRQGFAQPERHIIFRDSTTERQLMQQEGPLFHTSQAIEPDDEFLKVFLNGDDEDEEDDDFGTEEIPPAGKVIKINTDEARNGIVLQDALPIEEEIIINPSMDEEKTQPPIINNKNSQDGKTIKKRKYKKRKKSGPKKGSATKGGSKEGKQESKPQIREEVSADVRSNGSEEGGI
jgi:hypothetical protein